MYNKTLWFDFENAPHVWVLKEIIKTLESKGYKAFITARDFSNTLSLCDYLNIPYTDVSVNKNNSGKISKFYSIFLRSVKLKRLLRNNNIKPLIAISHGSRSQALASSFLGIKQISLDDYEYSFSGFNRYVNYLLTPFPVQKEDWGKYKNKVINYPGLKEELYLCNKENYCSNDIYLDNTKINIIFRPESTTAHYSNKESNELQEIVINKFEEQQSKIFVILFPRDDNQKNEICEKFFSRGINYYLPEKSINGPAIISKCDLLIGGGGTMTREACVLGIPSYTFFKGKLGAVDKHLIKEKKLFIIKEKNDMEQIVFDKVNEHNINISGDALKFVTEFIEKTISGN